MATHALAFALGLIVACSLGAGYIVDEAKLMKEAVDRKEAELISMYAAQYSTDLELIEECKADGLAEYVCVKDLRTCK